MDVGKKPENGVQEVLRANRALSDELFPEPMPTVDELFPEPMPTVDELFPEPMPTVDELFAEAGTMLSGAEPGDPCSKG